MRSVTNSVTALAVAGVAGLGAIQTVAAVPFNDNTRFGAEDPVAPPLSKRDVTTNGDELSGQTYDYVIVGGGLAGLTVANRLSADPNVTVAVIEAGADIYGADQERFLTPSAVLYDSFLNTDYDWKWVTSEQAGLGGRTTPWPRGKVLGGSSSVNSMYMVRASQQEFDSWGSLIGDADQWGWDSMFAAMKKSEDFQEPQQDVQSLVPSLQYNAASHGTGGPIKTGWPGKEYAMVQPFFDAVSSLGTPVNPDPDSGDSWGAFLATSAINSQTWQRCSSRNGYLDDIDFERSNIHVLVDHQVTKVLFDTTDGVTATGVQYATNSSSTVHTVNAAREVIISGGTINSPVILQHSGIGEASKLNALGIDTVIDLPGVGQNVQDHLSAALLYPLQNSADGPPSEITGDAKTDSFVQSAVAYINLTTLVGSESESILANLRNNVATAVNSYDIPDTVKQGYNATYLSQVNNVYDSSVGLVEILFADIYGTINIQVALQQPLSRGSILINSNDPFNGPTIDPGYLSQDIDLHLLREGHKLARRIGSAMSGTLGAETSPGSSVSDDDSWNSWIKQNAGTEYHPSSSCSMLPRELGGVVDKNLLVYGTTNLRVIDASVAPTAVSAHLMTATYGIAEIGAEIIRAAYA
ncbi:Glucose oxidase [Cytospora mali]|uniref:Glucose oxidase n=1 Tax=Cytospora mali TaxID=578113 RepID=A0A194V1P8_CYTMA|nr:Glucose oxidase [Valsa mali var. pyri (nom. inval.)]